MRLRWGERAALCAACVAVAAAISSDRMEAISRKLLTADANSPHRQAAPVGVGQSEAPSAELPTEQPIFGYQVGEGVTLAALQPTGKHDEEQL